MALYKFRIIIIIIIKRTSSIADLFINGPYFMRYKFMYCKL